MKGTHEGDHSGGLASNLGLSSGCGSLYGLDLLNGGDGGGDNFRCRHYCRTRRELV